MNPNRVVLGVALLFAAMLTADLASKPDRPEPPKKGDKALVPDLRGRTNWGLLTQEKEGKGRKFSIDEHPIWFGEGEIREDCSTAFILWTLRSNGHPCPGVYKIVTEGKPVIQGDWGYAESVTVEPDGTLSGATMRDRVYRTDVED